MINKSILKQTAKENTRMLVVITTVLSVFLIILVKVFNPSTISGISSMIKSTPLAGILGSTFLGTLAQSYYSIHAIILPLIFIVIVGNNLIVAKVDRGSMAYTLSTPIKRSTIVITQAFYFIMSLVIMITVVTLVGIFAIQGFYGTIWGDYITSDVQAIADKYDLDANELEQNLTQILDNEDYIKAGASARELDEEIYISYLNQKIAYDANKAAAEVLNVEITDVQNDLSLVTNNQEALAAAAEVYGMNDNEYLTYLNQQATTKEKFASQSGQIQSQFLNGLQVASAELDMELNDLTGDLSILLDDDNAIDTVIQTSGLNEDIVIKLVDTQIASSELANDNGLDFELSDYILINVGLFLLMFATSGIAFFASCFFNLTNKYMIIGGGIPLAFFLFKMMSEVSDSLEPIKYLTMNSLYDTGAILAGEGYQIKFITLAVIGLVLYIAAIKVFTSKDLPL
ncbi:MAG: hypothetical protein ACK5HR_07000 [Mycoplasmatales bacterium]